MGVEEQLGEGGAGGRGEGAPTDAFSESLPLSSRLVVGCWGTGRRGRLGWRDVKLMKDEPLPFGGHETGEHLRNDRVRTTADTAPRWCARRGPYSLEL